MLPSSRYPFEVEPEEINTLLARRKVNDAGLIPPKLQTKLAYQVPKRP